MDRKWVVAVLSTNYDLQEYRNTINKKLSEMGFSVSAYELPEYPVEADIHSHTSCLVALKRVDIALTIIDKRSGGIFKGIKSKKDTISITEAEYLESIKQGIPVFTFVKQNAYDELHSYKKDRKAYLQEHAKDKKKTKEELAEEFDKSYVTKYVEDVKTLHFIDRIQKSYEANGNSNWMCFFSDIPSFEEQVIGKLKGYSRALIYQLAEKQKERLLNFHSSTAIGMSLRDVFSSNLFIDPPFEVTSGKSVVKGKKKLSTAIKTALDCNHSVLIYGEAGYGKTTIIAKCFTENVKYEKKDYRISLFLSLRNKGSDYSFSIKDFINEEIKDLFDGKDSYPCLCLADIKLRFFCDGFDELTEALSERDMDRIRNTEIFQQKLVLTCRQQFVTRYLNIHSFSDDFGIRIRMEKWGISTVEGYVKKYFAEKKSPKEIEMLLSRLTRNKDISQLLDSPLLVTMLISFIEENGVDKDISRTELFKYWTLRLAQREHDKNISISSDDIINVWKYVAWQIYSCRRNNCRLKREDLQDLLQQNYQQINTEIALSTLETLFECQNDYINGTFHEQFMEYLVADYLIVSCETKKEPYPVFLSYVLRPEINRYFRSIWEDILSMKKKEMVFNAIFEQYINNIGQDDSKSVGIRVHAIYHICRLNYVDRRSCIERAFKVEKHTSVLLSLYFGVIKTGDLNKEDEFYLRLSKNPDFSLANRGYHLVYYADMIPQDNFPYVDDETSKWEGTLKAIERHFDNSDIGHYFMRRIDLFTICEFMNSRKNVGPVTEDFLNRITSNMECCIWSKLPAYEEYDKKIKAELDKVKTTYNMLTSGSKTSC